MEKDIFPKNSSLQWNNVVNTFGRMAEDMNQLLIELRK